MNEKSKHTPGPWTVGDGMSKYSNGEAVDVRSPQRPVCWIHFWADETITTKISQEQELADAVLISAAPEMLQACKLALDYLEPQHNNGHTREWTRAMIHSLKLAISKAEFPLNTPTRL